MRGFESVRAQFLLGIGQAAAQAYAARVDPDLFAGDARGGEVALHPLRRIAPGRLPDVPGVVVVGDAAGGHGEIEDAGRQIVGGQGEIARIACQQAALPVGDALARIGLVLLLGVAEDGELRMPAIDQVGIGHQSAKVLVAPLQRRVFEQNFGQRFGMRIDQFDAFAAAARQRLRLGFLHGVQHRVEQVERDHHQNFGQGIGALQLPGDPGGVPRQFFRARLRIHPVRLDITRQADMAHRVRIGIGVFEVGTMAGVRVGKDDLRAYLEARADGLGERVGGLDRARRPPDLRRAFSSG